MKNRQYYKKRGHKVTSINIEHYQDDFLKSQKINISLLARDLIEKFLSEHFGHKYTIAKNEYLEKEEGK